MQYANPRNFDATYYQSRYADWMNAQNNNDYYRAKILSEIYEALPSKQDFNNFVKDEFGFTSQQLSETGRILQAYNTISDVKVWERIGYQGVRRVLEIHPEMQKKVFEKIRRQANTRFSPKGLQKVIDSCGGDHRHDERHDERNNKRRKRSKQNRTIFTGNHSDSHRDSHRRPKNETNDRLINALSSALRENGIDPTKIFDETKPRNKRRTRSKSNKPICLSV